jgi:hypothetical protein
MNRSSFFIALVAALPLGLVASNASAYSGTVTRNVCPSAALTNWFAQQTGTDGGTWNANGSNLCQLFADTGSTGPVYATGWISVPFDSSSSPESVTMNLTVFAGAQGGGAFVQIQSFAFDASGNASTSSGEIPSMGDEPFDQVLSANVEVPAGGAVVTVIQGEGGSDLGPAVLEMVSMQWEAQSY